MQIEPNLKRTITPGPAILLVVSGIIGSGVFKKIAPMSAELHSPALIMSCWVIAGMLSLIGALCTAELAAMMPGSGGEYKYFARIYGKLFAFLYGWSNMTIIRSSTIAALALVFSESFSVLVPLPELMLFGTNHSLKVLATLLIAGLSAINYRGVIFSERLSRVMIILILLVIAAFVIAGLSSPKGAAINFEAGTGVPSGSALVTAMFAAALGAFWGYEGWNNLGFLGDEIKNPQKTIPIALGIGTIIVIIIYLSLNAIYLYVLPVDQLAAMDSQKNLIAAVDVAGIISGHLGIVILSVLILFTTFNCTNTTILTSARILFAMSRDRLFLKSAGNIHSVFQTPSTAIVLQAFWAIALLWFTDFNGLTNLLIFAAFIFYGVSALGVLIMRRKSPDEHRPYRAVGYPVLPAFFVIFCLVLLIITLIGNPVKFLSGLGLIAIGIPVYYYYLMKWKGQERGDSRSL